MEMLGGLAEYLLLAVVLLMPEAPVEASTR